MKHRIAAITLGVLIASALSVILVGTYAMGRIDAISECRVFIDRLDLKRRTE